jgi:hypothetical protein
MLRQNEEPFNSFLINKLATTLRVHMEAYLLNAQNQHGAGWQIRDVIKQ